MTGPGDEHMDPANVAPPRRIVTPPPPLNEAPDKIDCYGCGKRIVYPPARVCTRCLIIGNVTEPERAALGGTP